MRLHAALILLACALSGAGSCVFPVPASATAAPPPPHWLIQKPDLARIRAAGATARFQWVMCMPRRPSATGCPVPTFTSYYEFRAWAPGHPGATAEIDYENGVTPPWQLTHLLRYIQLSARAGRVFRIFTIFSPVTSPATVPGDTGDGMLQVDEQAARYGADVVDIQRQWMAHHPWRYAAVLKDWVPKIRAAGPQALVLANLSTNPEGRPVTVWDLTETYRLTRQLVDGYWLITPAWTGHPGCAPQGCPQVAVEFLNRIGA